ncbi:3304_t:CDS:10, partial [Gigaspora margarita]
MFDNIPLLPVEEVNNKWSPDKVIDFLDSHKDKLFLKEEDIEPIKKNWVDGLAFLSLTLETLTKKDGHFVLLYGPVKKIADLVTKIKGKDQKLKKKRKAEEEFVITKPKKRRWEVNGAIQPNIVHAVYFVDPMEESRPLLEKIQEGQFVALHGARTSGKSTRVHQIQKQLNDKGYVCIYVSLEQINIKSVDNFWHTLGSHLYLDENRVVLFIDEFDMLYHATEDVLSSCLNTLHGIKGTKENYAIWSVVAIGPFSILYLNSNNFTTSPFNVNEPFKNPNFTLEQVQFLYKEFEDEYNLTIDQEVIEDIYTQTNGHAGLVCLCGRAIYRKLLSKLGVEMHLNYNIWQHFTAFLLENEILEYPTFIRMKDVLLKDDTDTRRAINFIQSDFLVNNNPIYVAENKKDLALFLTAEEVLVPGGDAGTFKISSPLVPYHPSTGNLDILETLKQIVSIFDQETIKSCNSFKLARVLVNNANNREVPRESIYDAELYRIMSNWLGRFTVMGQWHLKYRASGHINNKYVDIVISRPDHPTIALELLAIATKKELKEHYERALLYDKKLPADDIWIVHFTCEENAISEPCWPTKSQLQKGLRAAVGRDEFSSLQLISDLSTVNSNNTLVFLEDKTIDDFLDQKEKERVSNMIREKNREKKLQCELTENRSQNLISVISISPEQNYVNRKEKCQEISVTNPDDRQKNFSNRNIEHLSESKSTNYNDYISEEPDEIEPTNRQYIEQGLIEELLSSDPIVSPVSSEIKEYRTFQITKQSLVLTSVEPLQETVMKNDDQTSAEVSIPNESQVSDLSDSKPSQGNNQDLEISEIQPENKVSDLSFSEQCEEKGPIMFKVKPNSELIIKSVLEQLPNLKFRNSFRGIDNYSFASPQPWSSPCPICNRKHGNYGLHSEWYRKNGNQLSYDPELAKLYSQDKLQYCLTCNTSSNKF